MQHSEPLAAFELSRDGVDAVVRQKEFFEASECLEAFQFADLVELQVEDAQVGEAGKVFNASYHVIGQVELSQVGEAMQRVDLMDLL